MPRYTIAAAAIVSAIVGANPCAIAGQPTATLAARADPAAPPRFDPSSILVRFDPAIASPARDAALILIGGHILREFATIPGLAHVRISVPVADALRALEGFPGVLYAEPDGIVHPAATIPNDARFNRLWGMHNTGQTVNGDPGTPDADIDAPEAWDLFTGDPDFVIAVVDTGVNYNHPDLALNAWVNAGEIPANGVDDDGNGYTDDVRGWDFYNEDADPMDDHGHGTFCAGVIGAVGNNGIGIAGVNWRCKIMALKFISAGAEGYISGAIGAIDYAVANGARVSSHSWGGYEYYQSLHDAITSAGQAGHLLVAASGNDGNDNDVRTFYPASYGHHCIIAVGGLDNDDEMPSFSNYGAVSVDLIAPAVNVYSAWGDGYEYGTGTSAAAPHAAGLASLLLGRNPHLSGLQARACIFANVRRLPALEGRVATGGVLNAAQALRRSPRKAAP